MIRPALPSFAELKNIGVPRVHPNGFIQVDLDKNHRLHVWHPLLPYRQKTYSPIHDHIFDFVSYVYSGRLINVVYDVKPSADGTHDWWQVQDLDSGKSTVIAPRHDKSVTLVCRYADVIQPGEYYYMPAYDFHETVAGEPTLTIIKKLNFKDAKVGVKCVGASVMVRRGENPDNDFRREGFDTDVLWRLIEEAYP